MLRATWVNNIIDDNGGATERQQNEKKTWTQRLKARKFCISISKTNLCNILKNKLKNQHPIQWGEGKQREKEYRNVLLQQNE